MRSPCFQLLTSRCLNDYVLPPGWLPCAAVNDSVDGYEVDEIDEALLARFLQVRVVPDVAQWTAWACREGNIHPKVIEFVESSPGIFDEPASNPRAWKYASDLLKTWESGERHQDLLATCLAGILGDKWAVAFVRVYADERKPLKASEIIDDYPVYRAAMRRWIDETHLDVVNASLEALKRHLQPQSAYNQVVGDKKEKGNVEMFFSDLPADLKAQAKNWLADRGFTGLKVSKRERC